MSREDQRSVDAAVSRAFARLGQPGALGDELSDDELLAGLFDEAERAAFEVHTARIDGPEADAPDPNPDAPEVGEAQRSRGALLGLALVAVAVMALLGFDDLRTSASAHDEERERSTGASAAMTHAQEPRVGLAEPGERHELERDDCRRVAGDVSLCSRAAASFRVGEGSTARALELELESGELELDGRRSRTSIALETALGRMLQRDGASYFRVAFDRGQRRLHVDVLAGSLIVEPRDGERVILEAGAQLDLDADDSVGSPAPAPASAPPSRSAAPDHAPPDPLTPDELLGRAQRELAAGDRAAALDLYRKLVDRHPSSDAGRIARVSLARMLLAGKEHRAALVEFDAYLDDEGGRRALVEEARYGRVRCLRALGRRSELREALDSFAQLHPNSLHARRIQDWRDELDGETLPP